MNNKLFTIQFKKFACTEFKGFSQSRTGVFTKAISTNFKAEGNVLFL